MPGVRSLLTSHLFPEAWAGHTEYGCMNELRITQQLIYAGHLWLTGETMAAAVAYAASPHRENAAHILNWSAEFAHYPGRFRPLRQWLCKVSPTAWEFIEGELGPF